MAEFRCKTCGAALKSTGKETIVTCEYCDYQNTIPRLDNEKKTNLYSRATRLRFECKFDNAETIFQTLVSEYTDEAEFYWGLCLCKYGIEYVEDPLNGSRVPTCHRTSFDSILNDPDYLSTLKYASPEASSLYKAEAEQIDKLQKRILSIVKDEKPYDVFICYKESDENMERTLDSVLAQEIYDDLINKGLKVFFSRITLEDKLGVDYEPYIFSALQSAKVMLVVTTNIEYVNAVWVKNEWGRFVRLMKDDKDKVIIPCYIDIDPEDLPAALRTKQAQDMSKVGAKQDLVRGIIKIIGKKEEVRTAASKALPKVENFLNRGNLALEEKQWSEASKFFEQALNEDYEEARAYFGKVMAKFKVKAPDMFLLGEHDISSDSDYTKALKFADDEFKDNLIKYGEANGKLIESLTKEITNDRKALEKFKEKKEVILTNKRTYRANPGKNWPRIEELQEQIDRVNGYRKIQKDLSEEKRNLNTAGILELGRKKRIKEKIEKLNESLKTFEQEYQKVYDTELKPSILGELEAKRDNLKQHDKEQLQKEKEDFFNAANAKLEELEQAIESLEQKINNTQKRLDTVSGKITSTKEVKKTSNIQKMLADYSQGVDLIKTVRSVGSRDNSNVWIEFTEAERVINLTYSRYLIFNFLFRRTYGMNENAMCKTVIFDEKENIVYENTDYLQMYSTNDKTSHWIDIHAHRQLVPGKYTVVYCIGNSRAHKYEFEIVREIERYKNKNR